MRPVKLLIEIFDGQFEVNCFVRDLLTCIIVCWRIIYTGCQLNLTLGRGLTLLVLAHTHLTLVV